MNQDELEKLFGAISGARRGWLRRAGARRAQTFRLGDQVRITSGPFASYTGTVTGINQGKLLLRVALAIFGVDKQVAVRFADVEKVSGE